MDTPDFVKGMFVEDPHPNAPEFVKARISIKCSDLVNYMREHQNKAGYINVDMLRSKGGKLYLKLNTFTPEKQDNKVPLASVADMDFSQGASQDNYEDQPF